MGGKRRQGGLTPDDHALWSAYSRSIKPLRGRQHDEIPAKPAEPEAPARPAASQNPGPSRLKHPPRAEPARPSGLDHRTRKQVSRGRIAIEDRIDLHGMRQAEAHAALRGFICSAVARRLVLVLVITGKGRVSETGAPWWEARETGVLRRLVPEWLHQRDLAPLVVGFEAAGPGHGSEGALYVRLRRRKG